MSIASLPLCEELYKLSGWDDTYWEHRSWRTRDGKFIPGTVEHDIRPTDWLKGASFAIVDDGTTALASYPAYDLGYLLRKLQPVTKDHGRLFVTTRDGGDWTAGFSATYDRWHDDKGFGDTPENAASSLAIELFKEGILK